MQISFKEKDEIKNDLNMLSLVRLEDIRTVKQFNTVQILGFFSKLCLMQPFTGNRYPCTLHRATWLGSQAC